MSLGVNQTEAEPRCWSAVGTEACGWGKTWAWFQQGPASAGPPGASKGEEAFEGQGYSRDQCLDIQALPVPVGRHTGQAFMKWNFIFQSSTFMIDDCCCRFDTFLEPSLLSSSVGLMRTLDPVDLELPESLLVLEAPKVPGALQVLQVL